MTDHTHPDEPLSRPEVREQLAFFSAEDRRLTQRLADMYRSGQSGPAAVDLNTKARAAATAMLNGNAARFLPKKAVLAGQSEADVYVLREGVRLILDSLNQKDRELEVIEREERAQKLTPEFKPLVREWLVAAQKFAQADARAQAYVEAAGDVGGLLPMSLWIGTLTGILRANLDDMIAAAKAQGIKV
jgi:hypothetical protein